MALVHNGGLLICNQFLIQSGKRLPKHWLQVANPPLIERLEYVKGRSPVLSGDQVAVDAVSVFLICILIACLRVFAESLPLLNTAALCDKR